MNPPLKSIDHGDLELLFLSNALKHPDYDLKLNYKISLSWIFRPSWAVWLPKRLLSEKLHQQVSLALKARGEKPAVHPLYHSQSPGTDRWLSPVSLRHASGGWWSCTGWPNLFSPWTNSWQWGIIDPLFLFKANYPLHRQFLLSMSCSSSLLITLKANSWKKKKNKKSADGHLPRGEKKAVSIATVTATYLYITGCNNAKDSDVKTHTEKCGD